MVLEVRAARYHYGASLALDGASLQVAAGECVALLGPNGAGKTTLVNLIVGLLSPQQGVVTVAGADPRHAATRRHIGVVQQSLGYPRTLKVGELVRGAAVRGGAAESPRTAAEPILAELELAELSPRRASKLSGGQRQRLQLAMALVTHPALLVLDEPTAGLDASARRAFWRIIMRRRERGAAVLVTTHLIEESAAVAERVVVLDQGTVLASDSPDALMARLPDRSIVARTALDRTWLSELDGVVSLHEEGDRIRLGTRYPEALLRVLLAEDEHLCDLRVEGAGLEESVLALTDHKALSPARASVAGTESRVA